MPPFKAIFMLLDRDYKKVSILGNSAAGKSTLSKILGEKLGLKVFTIDKIFWQPDWKMREHSSYRKLHDAWLLKESWLIDGIGYWEELEKRLNMSDFVIYYDAPVSLCKQRAEKRIAEEKVLANPNITEGCRYKDIESLQMRAIENFEIEIKPKIMNVLKNLDPSTVQLIHNKNELRI